MTGAATRIVLAGVLFIGLTAAPNRDLRVAGGAAARMSTVSVATVWTTPQSPRPVDHPALTNPVDIRGWLSAMTPDQQETLTSDDLNQTQALFGDRVIVVREQGDWDEVRGPRASPHRRTPRAIPAGFPRRS